jgi:hypothetical protein
MMASYRFYGVNIDTPLSLAHNTGQFSTSTIGQLNAKSGQIFIREIPPLNRNAEFGWRVVDAFFSDEDVTITYFRAFGLDGEPLPQATFGVNYSSVPNTVQGVFKFQPEFGNRYYVPAQNNMHTPNTGGYTVQVLDLEYPSEGMAFGLFKQGQQHQALIISFRLFKLGPGYPNDLNMTIR